MKLILSCLMKITDLKTGEEVKLEAVFRSRTEINLAGTRSF